MFKRHVSEQVENDDSGTKKKKKKSKVKVHLPKQEFMGSSAEIGLH